MSSPVCGFILSNVQCLAPKQTQCMCISSFLFFFLNSDLAHFGIVERIRSILILIGFSFLCLPQTVIFKGPGIVIKECQQKITEVETHSDLSQKALSSLVGKHASVFSIFA